MDTADIARANLNGLECEIRSRMHAARAALYATSDAVLDWSDAFIEGQARLLASCALDNLPAESLGNLITRAAHSRFMRMVREL